MVRFEFFLNYQVQEFLYEHFIMPYQAHDLNTPGM